MKITALAPWFGSNRMLAENVGAALEGCKWVGVPFAGGMSELVHIKAPTILVNDLHRHVINLARCAAHPKLGPALIRRLRRRLMHSAEHAESQGFAREAVICDAPNIDAAEHYFVSVWQGRSSRAGMSSELTGGTCVRWTGSGGSSATRFRSATESLAGWRKIFANCDFVTVDVFDFLARVVDRAGHGLYLDPPFPGAGSVYKHNPGKGQQEANWHASLAERVSRFERCRIVCRFYDHPLIRELYQEPMWEWNILTGRKQTNAESPEVLLVRN